MLSAYTQYPIHVALPQSRANGFIKGMFVVRVAHDGDVAESPEETLDMPAGTCEEGIPNVLNH
jgi:hypothetical protein